MRLSDLGRILQKIKLRLSAHFANKPLTTIRLNNADSNTVGCFALYSQVCAKQNYSTSYKV